MTAPGTNGVRALVGGGRMVTPFGKSAAELNKRAGVMEAELIDEAFVELVDGGEGVGAF